MERVCVFGGRGRGCKGEQQVERQSFNPTGSSEGPLGEENLEKSPRPGPVRSGISKRRPEEIQQIPPVTSRSVWRSSPVPPPPPNPYPPHHTHSHTLTPACSPHARSHTLILAGCVSGPLCSGTVCLWLSCSVTLNVPEKKEVLGRRRGGGNLQKRGKKRECSRAPSSVHMHLLP